MKHTNQIPMDHVVQTRSGIPSDYHCSCEYCQGFLGEIYHVDSDKYYSNRIRKGYYSDKAGDHLDVGHVIGYKWAVQNLCPEGGWVFDPTAGTGTAVVEAILNRRNGIGIELEYPEVGIRNIGHQSDIWPESRKWRALFKGGDATKLDEYFSEWGFEEPFIDLIVNGTPYPKLSGRSSDSPERKNLKTGEDKSFDYMHEDNIGLTKGDPYKDLVRTIYTKSIKYLKKGGYFVILIKDLVQNKKPYLLHKQIIDIVLEACPEMEHYGFFLHQHVPHTLFMSTYSKRFPDVKIPIYQTGIVLRKKGGEVSGLPVDKSGEKRTVSSLNHIKKEGIETKDTPKKGKGVLEEASYKKGFEDGLKKGLNESIKIIKEHLNNR